MLSHTYFDSMEKQRHCNCEFNCVVANIHRELKNAVYLAGNANAFFRKNANLEKKIAKRLLDQNTLLDQFTNV